MQSVVRFLFALLLVPSFLMGCSGGGPVLTDGEEGSEEEEGEEAGAIEERLFEVVGGEESDTMGRFASVGDLDADGLEDVALGAYRCSPHGCTDSGPGKVYVYYGSSLSETSEVVISDADLILSEGEGESEFGRSLAIGDVNGDGMDDLLVGAPGDEEDVGSFYVFFGSESGLSDVPDRVSAGLSEGEKYGTGIAVIGDVNGDAIDDFAVGAPYYTMGAQSEVGRVDLFLGNSSLSLTPDQSFVGEEMFVHLGHFIQGVGDMTGDGLDDWAVGSKIDLEIGEAIPTDAPGEVRIFEGSEGDLSDQPFSVIYGDDTLDDFGISLAGIGDINDDGVNDLLVGAGQYFHQFFGSDTEGYGKAYIFYGGPGLDAEMGTDDAALTLTGTEENGGFGFSVSSLGDLNGDSFADFTVSAPASNSYAGVVHLFWGNALLSSTSTADLLFYFGQSETNFGEHVEPLCLGPSASCEPWLLITAYRTTPELPEGEADLVSTSLITPQVATDTTLDEAGAAFFIPMNPYIE